MSWGINYCMLSSNTSKKQFSTLTTSSCAKDGENMQTAKTYQYVNLLSTYEKNPYI